MPKKAIVKEFGDVEYDKKKHCRFVIESVEETWSIYKFCSDLSISDNKFWRWCALHPEFNECYRIGLMKARNKWETEGRYYKDDEEWNMAYWEKMGELHFQTHRPEKVRLDINPEASPHQQYQQIISQANRGDFTSAEMKQVMEAVNIGVRAYEVFKQQGEIDKLREDFNKMSEAHSVVHTNTNSPTP